MRREILTAMMFVGLTACSTMPEAGARHAASSTSATVPTAVEAAACKREGIPRIGMTTAQLIKTCWGEPDAITQSDAKADVQYAYSGSRYVYLRNGVVRSIQTSGYDDTLIP